MMLIQNQHEHEHEQLSMPIFTSIEIKPSVWSILVNKRGKVLVAKRSKKSNNPGLWNFPGGGKENGESQISCAYRELKEELGISKETLTLESKFNIKTRDKLMNAFLFSIDNYRIKISPNEVHSIKWLTIDELAEDSRSPKKWHMPTFMILHNPQVFAAIQMLAVKRINPVK